jgi:hypothetical protein
MASEGNLFSAQEEQFPHRAAASRRNCDDSGRLAAMESRKGVLFSIFIKLILSEEIRREKDAAT